MKNTDNVKMTINIGGEHLQLSVPFNRQDAVRDAEKAVAQLFDNWRLKWPARSDKEILAMIAYQFASFYQELLERHQKASEIAEDCNRRLEAMLKLPHADAQ